MIADEAKSPAKAARAVMTFGLAVVAAAFAWWLAYYSQHDGLNGLGDKIACFSNDAPSCVTLQMLIGPSAIPVYLPVFLWSGAVVSLVGFYLTRRNKA